MSVIDESQSNRNSQSDERKVSQAANEKAK